MSPRLCGFLLFRTFFRQPPSRVSQKTLKRREPQRHEDTKFFLCLSGLRSAGKKSLPLCLCAFVVQGFYAFCDTLELGNMLWEVDPRLRGNDAQCGSRFKTFCNNLLCRNDGQRGAVTFCDSFLHRNNGSIFQATASLASAYSCSASLCPASGPATFVKMVEQTSDKTPLLVQIIIITLQA